MSLNQRVPRFEPWCAHHRKPLYPSGFFQSGETAARGKQFNAGPRVHIRRSRSVLEHSPSTQKAFRHFRPASAGSAVPPDTEPASATTPPKSCRESASARCRMGRFVQPSNRTPGRPRRKSLSGVDGVTFEEIDVNGLLRYFGHGAGDTGPLF